MTSKVFSKLVFGDEDVIGTAPHDLLYIFNIASRLLAHGYVRVDRVASRPGHLIEFFLKFQRPPLLGGGGGG